jgi:NADPH:quinone reductase
MRALRFDRFGDPSVLQLLEVPRPVPSAGEALIEVRAAAINPSDVKNVAGGMSQTSLPRIPGRDYAGVVVEGPADWRSIAVWGTGGELGFTRDGAHAEAVLVPVAALRRKPAHLGFAEAAAAGTPFVTAALGLTRASLTKGEVVLVAGAAGAVGGTAVQIAAWRGATVVGLEQDEDRATRARALGAERVAVHREGDLADTLRSMLGAMHVDVAFDTTGVALDACVRVLARGGRVVEITAPPDGLTTFHLREFYRRDARLYGVDSLKVSAVEAAGILDGLAAGFESGALRPPAVTARFPLDAGAQAYRAPGKVVLLPTPE